MTAAPFWSVLYAASFALLTALSFRETILPTSIMSLHMAAFMGIVPQARLESPRKHWWMRQTLKCAILRIFAVSTSALMVCLIILTAMSIAGDGGAELSWHLQEAIYLGVYFVVFTCLFSGGDTLLQHGVLRLLLACFGHLPLQMSGFLDRGVELGLLRRVGNGHTFAHHSFQEHLAGDACLATRTEVYDRPQPTPGS